MRYFEVSNEVLERAQQTHEQYNRQFAEKVKLSNTELAIAAAAGCLGGIMDMFLVTNVNNLSTTNKIGFKPESEIKHLSQSGVINKYITDLTYKFHKSSFAKLLEMKCKVPFDKTVKTGVLGLVPDNHRLLTPGHDPILGLFYGTRDIMRGTFTVCDNSAETFVLSNAHGQQTSLPLAFLKEIGHLLSDIGSKTSLPFPGLWLMCQIEGRSPVNDYTWTMLANGLYRKGFTVDHLIASSVPLFFANVTLYAVEFIYGYILKKRGEPSPLDDPQLFKHRIVLMRTLAYAIMVALNITKVAISHGNLFAANPALYAEFVRNGFPVLCDRIRMEEKRHQYVMGELQNHCIKSQERFDKLLNYNRLTH